MSELVIFQEAGADQMQLPAAFAGIDNSGDLADGVGGSYAILSMKGSRFQVKYQGTSTVLTDPATGDPKGSFEAVIVKGNPAITKQFYEKGFTEGDTSSPDCFSLDGKTPAAAVEQPQHSNCAACPKNQFGSRINPQTGVKSKACADNRKLAVSPLGDIDNELLGGPMLFRVPATALKDLAMFSDTLKARGYPYNAVAVRIGFDINVSYPKPTFKAIRPLTDDEANKVLEWYRSEHVEKVLAEFAPVTVPDEVPPVDEVFEQPMPTPAKAPVKPAPPAPPVVKPAAAKAAPPAAPKPAPKPAPAAKAPAAPPARPAAAKPAPVQAEPEPIVEDTSTEVVPGNLENDIASILADLNSIATE